MEKLSPMMQQYLKIKDENKDSILFFRLGDFYEMFFDDAKLASKELELTLTGRDCGLKERAPMCGVPYHSCESYIARLVQKGYKVAICEQMEDPSKAKSIVQRDIVRVVTPGTVIESSMLDESRNNYICCIYAEKNNVAMCFCDISTGELYVTDFKGKDCVEKIKSQLTGYNPREILIGGDVIDFKELPAFIKDKLSTTVEMLDESSFAFMTCNDVVKSQFKNDYELISDKQIIICALGALMSYLKDTQKNGLERINRINLFSENQFMRLDFNTQRNLELTQTMLTKEKRGSLLWVLDKTKTSMGKRLLRNWIEKPLLNVTKIINRQSAVEELVNDTVLRLDLTAALVGIFDIERLMTNIVYGSAKGRELRSLASAVEKLPQIKELLQGCESSLLKQLYNKLDTLEDVYKLIDDAIVEEPPFTVKEGGIIKRGYNQELDEVSEDMNNSTGILSKLEEEQRELTKIPKLRVGYNRVFGYYIEVTNSYKDMVPETYIRKQTLTNCERYITQELKNIEGRILGAKDKAIALEYKLFDEIRKQVASQLERVQDTASAIAELDVLNSLANVASDNRYVRPDVNLKDNILLKDSRHPVVEQLLNGAPFVPNDVYLNCSANRVAIITGPNMAGKSTYMRQVALIVLMAQIGSFVPAASAEIGIVDSIFTRVGASDDLASGQSTFMVEMSEVANIVTNATSKSLLILDEIGRGTSTFDGMSIARAVLEYVADKKKLGAKALFATHYHELTVLEEVIDGVNNFNIAVKKKGDDITFLRRIVPGGADDSYGIEVAKLAGIPDYITDRAKEILSELESGNSKIDVINKTKKSAQDIEQLSLMPSIDSAIADKLKNVDLNTLTPIEAMNLLYELKNMV
ncbi:MAG: DNA mismatch repair protein MutS [Ruminococcus sp.]|nr:DNA mismatch repair protein MutS [Ruminococcus sp.]